MTKRAALYLRVSTCEQTTNENQRRELEEVAEALPVLGHDLGALEV